MVADHRDLPAGLAGRAPHPARGLGLAGLRRAGPRGLRAQRLPRHQRATQGRAPQGRVRLGGEPRAAHPAHLDPGGHRPARERRPRAPRRRGAGDGAHRRRRLRPAAPARQRAARHPEAGVRHAHAPPEPAARSGPILEQAWRRAAPTPPRWASASISHDEAPAWWCLADTDRLAQVVANLLSNAIKYTPAGRAGPGRRAAPPAWTRASASPSRIAAPACPRSSAGSLFQKFSQADTSDARQKGGTGLGLAICKVIVEKLGGTIAHEPAGGGRGPVLLRAAGAAGGQGLRRQLACEVRMRGSDLLG